MKKPAIRSRTGPNRGFQVSARTTQIESYESRLERNREWAMQEASRFFEGKSEIHDTLKKITQKLRDLGIDYVVVGGLAMFQHGYRRFTEDVYILVTREGLKEIHHRLEGLGYLPPFQGSKNLRDMEHGVRIEFLLTGEFPGDGKPKPVAFPIPGSVAEEIEGVRYITLPALVELKLASGMTNSERMKDLADVLELIKVLNLPQTFADSLNPFVRDQFTRLWQDAHPRAKRYVKLWRNKWLTAEAKSLEELIQALQSAADTLRSMQADGITLDAEGGTGDDYAYLVTRDPTIAKKYDMHDEKEFWADEGEDEEHAGDDVSTQPPGA